MIESKATIREELRGKRITIAGAARSGLAAARLLSEFDVMVFVSDSGSISEDRRAWLAGQQISFEEGGHTGRATEADFIITSPGIPASSTILLSASESQIPVYSELEFASWFCDAPIVAITGSNGKTTTTSIIGDMLAASGRPTHVAGNIGRPFSDVVLDIDPEDAVVLEVSSFQLEHINEFHPRISVLLNITPDHMNRYDHNLDTYAETKYKITMNQTDSDVMVYNMDDTWIKRRIAIDGAANRPRAMGFTHTDNRKAAGFLCRDRLVLNMHATEEVLMHKEELSIPGRHNVYNSLAASIAARMMEVGSDTVRNSLSSFEGVAHRLEFVREVDGVRYINDSKATNVNALWYALESFNQSIILIAGGRDKGNDYSSVAPLVKERVRLLISIGESAAIIDQALGPYVEKRTMAESMGDAVRYASNLARSGETVLLSPACSSFDMFANFEARGDAFKRLISNL